MKLFLLVCLSITAVLVAAGPSYSEEAGPDKKLAAMMEAMRDPDPMVRRVVARSLGEAGSVGAVPVLVDVLGSDPDVNVRLNSLGALVVIGDKSAVPAYEKALGDEDPRVRESAAKALSGSWGETAHKALMEALKNEKSARVRRRVAEALGNPGVMGRYSAHGWEGSEITQTALIYALNNDEDYGVRATAAQMLGRFKNAVSLKALLGALEKEDSLSVKSAAAQALGEMEMPAAVQPLVDIVYFEREDILVMSALKALKYYADPKMEDAVVAALDSRSAGVRWQAIDVLEELRSRDSVEPLTRIAEDEYESEGVRFKAREALQLMGVQ